MTTTAGKIAKTVFQTGPDDKLIPTDIYASNPDTKSAINIPDIASNLGTNIQNAGLWLGSSNGLLSLLQSTTFKDGKLSVDPKSLTKRLIDASGGVNSPFYDLEGKAKTLLITPLTNMVQGNVANILKQNPNAILTYNNVTAFVKKAEDIKSAQDVVSLLNSVAGLPVPALVKDVAAQLSVYKGIVDETGRLRIPGVIELLADKFDLPKDKVKFALDVTNSVVQYSDLAGLNSVIATAGSQALLANRPSIISEFLTNYRFESGVTPAQYPSILTQLKSTLASINPDWYRYKRNGVYINNLEPFTNISQDATTLFMIDSSLKIPTMIAKNYPMRDKVEMLRSVYRYTSFTS